MKNGFVEEVRCFVAGRPAKRLHGIESFGCIEIDLESEAAARRLIPACFSLMLN